MSESPKASLFSATKKVNPMETAAAKDKPLTVLMTLAEIKQYLTEHNIEDNGQDLIWTCPNCGTTNTGAYYARNAECAGCHEYSFPALGSGRVDDLIRKMEKQVEGWRSDIAYFEDEIAGKESEIQSTGQTVALLKGGLKKLGPLSLMPGSLHPLKPPAGTQEAQGHMVDLSALGPVPGAAEGQPQGIRGRPDVRLGIRHIHLPRTLSCTIRNWFWRTRARMAKNVIKLNKKSPGEVMGQYIRISTRMASLLGPYAAVIMFLVYFFSAYLNPEKMVVITFNTRGEANTELFMCFGFILCMLYAVYWIVIKKQRISD